MNIRIYLLVRPSLDLEVFLRFLNSQTAEWRRSQGATEAEEIVEIAGRICYMSFGDRQSPRDNPAYLENLIKSGHESVLEHVNWTFLLEGVSRALTHQLVRHRPGWAFSQLSQQYHDEAGATFIEPEEVAAIPELASEWRTAVESARTAYIRMIEVLNRSAVKRDKESMRRIRSAARSVLPNATETKIVVTANARALRHFLRVRGAIEGDSEMRMLCAELLKHLSSEAPQLFYDFSTEFMQDGSPVVLQNTVVTRSE